MKTQESTQEIRKVINVLAKDIEALSALGKGIPAVEKNMVRMRGTLRALEVQFDYGAPAKKG